MPETAEGRERIAKLEVQVGNLVTQLERAFTAISGLTQQLSDLNLNLAKQQGFVRGVLFPLGILGSVAGLAYWLGGKLS